jgi:hypothetical protein
VYVRTRGPGGRVSLLCVCVCECALALWEGKPKEEARARQKGRRQEGREKHKHNNSQKLAFAARLDSVVDFFRFASAPSTVRETFGYVAEALRL